MLWLLLLQVWASCLWLGHSEVVPSFANTCNQFFYQKTPPNNALEPKKPAWICQTLNNQTFFATLYNREKRIPVYSAYKYEPKSFNTTHTWTVEPQLIDSNLSKNMQTVQTLKRQNISTQQIRDSQAVNTDYQKTGFDRGHLNPNGHHNTTDSRNATFTLTNIVPMNRTLNQVAWKNYEQQTMHNKSQGCQTTYAIVGAVPGNSSISSGRVNVPSHIWAGACCKTNNTVIAWAAIAENNQNTVEDITLGELEKRLADLYNNGTVSLFHADCPRT